MGWEEAFRRVEKARKFNSSCLVLSNLGLTNEQLCEPLPQRGRFSSFRTEKKILIDEILKLTALETLCLDNNQLVSVPDIFCQLTMLKRLSICRNQLINVPNILGQLTGLRELYLSHNQLIDVSDSLGNLIALEKLSLRRNQLMSIPDSLGNLTRLRELYLSHNQLSKVPGSLGSLIALEKLNLRRNQLTNLPDSLGKLNSLEVLNLSFNRLTSIPESLGQLVKLKELRLDSNQLMWLPRIFDGLIDLKELRLDSNRLKLIPEDFGQMISLESLDLRSNELTSLPNDLERLRLLKFIYLHKNDALGIPLEITGPTWFEIAFQGYVPIKPKELLDYYFRIRESARSLNEAKLILVGRGRVGKTSLVKKLKNGVFNLNEAETEGIEIENLGVLVCFNEDSNKTENVHLHTWDFGGQEFVHATHRFFLTERSLYLLVLNGREGGAETEALYWLELIQSAGESSRVLVVLNRSAERPFDVNRGLLQEKFPNICGFIITDCKTGLGIEELKRAIERETARLDGVHSSFPANWFRLKDRVSGMQEPFLTFDRFQKLCEEYEIEEADRDLLTDVLNALGIALNFRKDDFLRDTHILNPRWVTGGVYKMLYAPLVRNANGAIKLNDLRTILDAREYPPPMHAFLMRLMQRFELCFPYPHDPDTFLIPELLPENQSDEVHIFKPEECLNFEYHYSVLPEGLMPRFIVRTHDHSEGEPRWRTGVILNVEGCRALVRADVLGKKILVRISGDELARRRVLSVIRSHFNAIHKAVKLKAEEMVPIPSKPHVAIPYLDLEMFEREGFKEFPKPIDGKIVMLQIGELLDGVRPPLTNWRTDLLITVSKLTKPQFDFFLELIEAPSQFLPSDNNGVAERAAALFLWIRQQKTIPLEDVAKALEAVTRKS